MKPAKSKTRLGPKTPSRTKLNTSPSERDPVQVYCRLRPLPSDTDVPCVKIVNSNTVVVSPPDTAMNYNNRNTNMKSMKYTFKEVFPPIATQYEVFSKVAKPLVENLIKGKNGLLFTYGVTGSGKTYTMTGEPQNCGVLPRCLKLIFKTIADYQAKKYIFVPDKMNMFEVHSEAEAMLTRQQELYKIKAGKKINSYPDLTEPDLSDSSKVDGIDEDNQYAVFITYVEIYNNCVFDLLEDSPSTNRTIQGKIVREDGAHNMYVHGVTELEVKSPEEAFEAFHKGLKRKRMAHTSLNAESSRSHSVFTIRLVQAPVDERGEAIVQDKKCICISQFSLVDLAGSERTNRTKNTGQRLREAGNINNSLMTLRACMEALRENQMNGTTKMVPYRDSKITHLFKNYFDGEGHVRMIVCVNPRAEDYDETMQVMRFAEMAAEVEVMRPIAAELGIGMTPGRRKANRLYTAAAQRLVEAGKPEVKELEMDLGLVYSLGPDFPSLELNSCHADSIIKELITHLQMRIEKREQLKQQKALRDEQFRSQLLDLEKSQMMMGAECTSLRTQLAQERKRRHALEERLVAAEGNYSALQRKYELSNADNLRLRREIQEKDMILSQTKLERDKQKRKYNHKIASEHEKMNRELEIKLKAQQDKLQHDMRDKEDKIRLVTQILSAGPASPPSVPPPLPPLSDLSNYPQTYTPQATQTPQKTPYTPGALSSRRNQTDLIMKSEATNTQRRGKGFAVSNPRHRRSLSEESGRGWLEHRPARLVPLGTVLRPNIARAKNITKLTSVKDIANPKTSKYCLISQEQDTDGELETRLYKGDVVPTCGGGAQVIFNDVEMLKQGSPAKVGTINSASSPPHFEASVAAPTTVSSCARHSNKRRDQDPHADSKKFKGSTSDD